MRRRRVISGLGRALRGPWLLVLLGVIAYCAWPYVTMNRLASALDAQDRLALDEMVDWAAVREGLRNDVNSLLAARVASGAQGTSGLIDPVAAEEVVELLATPLGLRSMVQSGGDLTLFAEGALPPGGVVSRLRAARDYSFFRGPLTFRVNLRFHDGPPVVALLRLYQNGWRLTRVYLPALSGERALDGPGAVGTS